MSLSETIIASLAVSFAIWLPVSFIMDAFLPTRRRSSMPAKPTAPPKVSSLKPPPRRR